MGRTAEAVIIGGGVTGVSTAFELAGRGLRRGVVLERKVLAAGGTGRSVGIVRQLYPTRETTEMVLRSLAVFQDFAAGMSGHGFKLAPAVGEMMAALIAGSPPPVSLAPFRLDRFASSSRAGTFVSSYLG